MRTMIVLLAVGMLACAGPREQRPLQVPPQAAGPDTAGYVVDGGFVAGPPLPGLHFAPSQGACAPAAHPLCVTACCGGNPCNGHCVFADSGRTACSCYGKAGGCGEGMICSKLAHSCVRAEEQRVP